MLLWRSDRFHVDTDDGWLRPTTKRGRKRHEAGFDMEPIREHWLLLDGVLLDIWLELHDQKAADRLEITVDENLDGYTYLLLEGQNWADLLPGEVRLLRRLGLVDGKRKCLWLEVWYREAE